MFQENLDRLSHPKMAWYRELYKDSERWNGVDCLAGKTVIVYGEQGYGDILQFVRYVPRLKQEGCAVCIQCPTPLHRLFEQLGVDLIDRDNDQLPEHDYHIPSMSLPFVLNERDVEMPYLKVDEKADLSELGDSFKIGIAWEGNPEHSNAEERNCPLGFFRTLESLPAKMIMIQRGIGCAELTTGCGDMELYGFPIEDFYDTAKIMNSLDYVVTVDTSILHLAGSLGKPTIGLLSYVSDPRWNIDVDWYPSITLLRQSFPNDWEGVLAQAKAELQKLTEGRDRE